MRPSQHCDHVVDLCGRQTRHPASTRDPHRDLQNRVRIECPKIEKCQAKTSEAPENSNTTRMVRRKPISLMLRNATMPSTEPANSAGRLIARSIATLGDRP